MNPFVLFILLSVSTSTLSSPPFIRFGIHPPSLFNFGRIHSRDISPYEINRIGFVLMSNNQTNHTTAETNHSTAEINHTATINHTAATTTESPLMKRQIVHDISHMKRLIDLIINMENESLRLKFYK